MGTERDCLAFIGVMVAGEGNGDDDEEEEDEEQLRR